MMAIILIFTLQPQQGISSNVDFKMHNKLSTQTTMLPVGEIFSLFLAEQMIDSIWMEKLLCLIIAWSFSLSIFHRLLHLQPPHFPQLTKLMWN